ncbi:transcriptional regulator [Escherichia coli]|nr:transcriptional regulator [Escherichia coli]HAV8993255.1 transcriptional regulator [Escherichia coli]HAV9027453.1 transcriptional regulator [Escherichia coli]HAW2960187.1 transcriptional regulator [Escherichia coli]HAW4017860.1 transcriptional regulator [Escherichia coli]
MFKSDVINFYGTKAKVAKAAGVDPSAVSQWGELVPEGRAMRLQEASGGELQYDPKVYDEYRKAKRAGRLNNENHL